MFGLFWAKGWTRTFFGMSPLRMSNGFSRGQSLSKAGSTIHPQCEGGVIVGKQE